MRPIHQETNVEVLRQWALMLESQVIVLSNENRKLKSQPVPEQDWLHKSLKDQLHRLQKKFYGVGRETVDSRPVGHENEQLKLHSERVHDEARPKKETEVELPLVIDHEASEEELVEEGKVRGVEAKASAWEKIEGLVEESTEITVTDRVYTKVTHRRAKYRLKPEHNQTDKDIIITAKGPAKVKAGSTYSIDFAVSVVSDKYEYHLPLERQRRKMSQAGFDVEVKTLYGLCENVAEHCQAILPKIRSDIMNACPRK